MLSFYLVLSIVFAAITYVALQKTENRDGPLLPLQYLAILACGLLWPVVAVILILDFWPRSEKGVEIEKDAEDIE